MDQFLDMTDAILACLLGLPDALAELEQAQSEVNRARARYDQELRTCAAWSAKGAARAILLLAWGKLQQAKD
eukprot:10103654-Alexandrium_andersonii.AAC.1